VLGIEDVLGVHHGFRALPRVSLAPSGRRSKRRTPNSFSSACIRVVTVDWTR